MIRFVRLFFLLLAALLLVFVWGGYAAIGTVTHTGGTQDDITVSGTFAGAQDVTFNVTISTAGAPDKYKWSMDGGTTQSSERECGTSEIELGATEITVKWDAATGHDVDEGWEFECTPDGENHDAYIYRCRGDAILTNHLGTLFIGTDPTDLIGGEHTIAIGRDALYNAPHPQYMWGSVAIGYGALYEAGGSGNVSIGQGAGYTSSGDMNVFIGYGCGDSAVDNNVIIGCLAGDTGVGSYNTLLGSEAGYKCTSNSTVSIGAFSLYSNTYGNNVAVGYHAGYSSLLPGNVFIGYDAGSNETGGNKLYIDNCATAEPLIYGDFSENELTIFGELIVDESLTVPVMDIKTSSGENPVLSFSDGDQTNPFTSLAGADDIGSLNTVSSTYGGLFISGYSDTDYRAMLLQGLVGASGSTSYPAVALRAGKLISEEETTGTDLAASEVAFQFENYGGTPVIATMLAGGNLGLGTETPTEKLDVNGDKIRIRSANTPASADAVGEVGEICWDTSYVYICVAEDTWRRAALSTW